MSSCAASIQNESPVISVVVPSRKGGKQVDRAIDSVLAQTEALFELIFVTDCGAVAEDPVPHIRRTDPRIRYVDLLNKTGANAARNLGTSLSQSEIITYLDADDELLPEALSNRIWLLKENENAGFVITSHYSISRKRTVEKTNHGLWIPRRGLERPLLASTLHVSASAIAVRRHLLDEIGCWNESLARLQDRDLLLRLTQVSPCLVSDRIDFRKIDTPGSITSSKRKYMQAYSDFLTENLAITTPYRHLVGFRVANRILTLLIEGKLRDAMHCYNENKNIQNLKFSGIDLIFYLVYGFFLGRFDR